jgi:hypothetical protein
MNRAWKAIIPLMLSGGLIACSTTGQQPSEPEEPQIEQPVVDPKPVEPTKPETKPEPPQPEVKPKPGPKPPVVEPAAQKTADGKLILGEKEWVYIPGLEQSFKARIDTGATTSSISAIEIIPFERDGKDWVKFKLEHEGKSTKEVALPVNRWVKVKQSSAEESQKRAVVEAWIQVGDLKEKTEFTLADRTHLAFPVLLGRSFFKDIALVDVSREFVQDKQ